MLAAGGPALRALLRGPGGEDIARQLADNAAPGGAASARPHAAARDEAFARGEFAQVVELLGVSFPRTTTLPDGSTGWYVRAPRGDDCWAACVSSCLQVPIEQVPDPQLDERLRAGDAPEDIDRESGQEEERWLSERGLHLVAHRPAPVWLPRWVGVVPLRGWFNSHSMLMCGGEVLFDPTAALSGVRVFSARDVTCGFSFEPTR